LRWIPPSPILLCQPTCGLNAPCTPSLTFYSLYFLSPRRSRTFPYHPHNLPTCRNGYAPKQEDKRLWPSAATWCHGTDGSIYQMVFSFCPCTNRFLTNVSKQRHYSNSLSLSLSLSLCVYSSIALSLSLFNGGPFQTILSARDVINHIEIYDNYQLVPISIIVFFSHFAELDFCLYAWNSFIFTVQLFSMPYISISFWCHLHN
jgi:hypothetical protein